MSKLRNASLLNERSLETIIGNKSYSSMSSNIRMISPKRGINHNKGDNYQSPLPPNRNPKLYKGSPSPRESRVHNNNNNFNDTDIENVIKDFDTSFDINDSIISPSPKKKKKNIKDVKTELITSFIDQSLGLYKGANDTLKQIQSKIFSNVATSDSQLQGTMLQQSLEELNFFAISNGTTIYDDNVTINYIIRVFPGQSFSLSLFVINTNQSWNLFIPYNENVIYLRQLQDKLKMSSQWNFFADKILQCIHVELVNEYIVSVNFDNDNFSNSCRDEINHILHSHNNNSSDEYVKSYLNNNKFFIQEPSTAMQRIFSADYKYPESDIINNSVVTANNEYINLNDFVSSQSFSESIVVDDTSEYNSIQLANKKNRKIIINNNMLNKTEKAVLRRERLLKCLDIYTKNSISNTLKSTVVKEISNMKTEMNNKLEDFQSEIKLLREQILSSSDYVRNSSMEWMKSDLENLSLISNFAEKKDLLTLQNEMSVLMLKFQEEYNQLQDEMSHISLEQTTMQEKLLENVTPNTSPTNKGSSTNSNISFLTTRHNSQLKFLDNSNNNTNSNNNSPLSDMYNSSNSKFSFSNRNQSSYTRTLGDVGMYTTKDGEVRTKPERSNLSVADVEELFSRLSTLELRLAMVESNGPSNNLSLQELTNQELMQEIPIEPVYYIDKNIASDRLKNVFRKVIRNNFYAKNKGTAVFRMMAIERIITITDNAKVISVTLDDCITTSNKDLCIHAMHRVVHVFTIEHPDAVSMKNIKASQILNVMNAFINDINILKLSYDAINAMISDDTPALIINNIKEDLASSDHCGLLLNALKDYTSNPLITFRATKCLHKITTDYPKFNSRLCQGNVELLANLFSQAAENPSVVENLAKIVTNVCKDNSNNQDRLAEVGLGEYIIECIEKYSSNERLIYLLCNAVSSLTARRHKANQLVCLRNKSPIIMIEMFNLYQKKAVMVEQLSVTILSLSTKSKKIKNIYIDQGIIKTIIQIFNNYLDIINKNDGIITEEIMKLLSYIAWITTYFAPFHGRNDRQIIIDDLTFVLNKYLVLNGITEEFNNHIQNIFKKFTSVDDDDVSTRNTIIRYNGV